MYNRLIIKMELYEVQGQSRLYQLGFGSLVANLVDFHFMSSSSSEGNINNLSIHYNKAFLFCITLAHLLNFSSFFMPQLLLLMLCESISVLCVLTWHGMSVA